MDNLQNEKHLIMPVLECNNLCKSFGGLQALQGFNICIDKRTSAGLVGPNGAGKTTLFSLCCGFLRPSSGTLKIMGHEPDSTNVKGRIGILPQDIPMLRGIAVLEQLKLFARLQGFSNRNTGQEVERIINLVKISSLVRQFPETLSYGQRKKVALAQALIGQPEVVLLDEPTSGLDPVAANEVRSIIQETRNIHTYLVSSHNLDEIKTVCDEVIIIDRGKLIRHCQINELIDRNNVFTMLLDKIPVDELLQSLKSLASSSRIETDRNNPKRLSIYFQDEDPDQFQYRVLECLRNNGTVAVEFSRGSPFADRVVELVNKQ